MTARSVFSHHLVLGVACCAGVMTLASPMRAADKKSSNGKNGPPPVLTWPLPPERPRIRYLSSYHGSGDFKPAKKPSRFLAAVLGSDGQDRRDADAIVKPYGIAVSETGVVYATDTATRRVFAFDTDKKTVSFVGENSSQQNLAKPIGVAVGPDGKVFVADATLKRVFAYSAAGELSFAIGHDGDLVNPSGVAIDSVRHRIYVADAAKHQILKFSSIDGSLIATIGKRGAEPGEFNFPTNLCVDAQGRLYVADTLNFRIQIFDADGGFLKTFGTIGDTPGSLNRPKGIAVDSEHHIYVADSSFNNFQIFDDEGRLLLFVGSGGNRPGEFMLPAGLSIDNRDRIYVADQGNSRIQVFQYVKTGGTE